MVRHTTFKCLYKTLGVGQNASKQQIRKAYAELAKLYHPDAGIAANANKFTEISDAYRVLSDPQLRQKYDLKRAFAVGDDAIDLSDVGIGKKKTTSEAKWDSQQWEKFKEEAQIENKRSVSYEGSFKNTYVTVAGIAGVVIAAALIWNEVTKARSKQSQLENYYNSAYEAKNEEFKVSKDQALVPSRFKKFKIIKREQLTPDTFMIRLDLGDKDAISGLGITSCILIKDLVGQDLQLTRAYTPVSEPGQRGYMDLVIKVAGRLSKTLSKKKVGDDVWVKGPIRKFYYGGPGTLSSISMIAGGSGITPHYQLLRVILNDPNDKTPIYMLYASRSTDDIILKQELDELAKKYPDQFHLTYAVDEIKDEEVAKKWVEDGNVIGRINEKIIEKHLHSPGTSGGKLFICGPGSLIEYLIGRFVNYDLYNIYHKSSTQNNRGITGALGKLGYPSNSVYEF